MLSDFKTKKLLGKGSYGKVYLIERIKNPGEVYAMKCIDKRKILKDNILESTQLEKEIMAKLDHPFLNELFYVFQTDSKIMFVMKFIRGGELYEQQRRIQRFAEEQAKFYIVQIILGLGNLHEHNIAYRDLKPENILI